MISAEHDICKWRHMIAMEESNTYEYLYEYV